MLYMTEKRKKMHILLLEFKYFGDTKHGTKGKKMCFVFVLFLLFGVFFF